MTLLWTLFIGLIVGFVAKLIMPGRDPRGMLITVFLGVAGSIVARFIGQAAGWYNESEPAGFIASVIGAILLLGIYRLFTRRRRHA